MALAVEAGILFMEWWGESGKSAGQDCWGKRFYQFLACELAPDVRDVAASARQGQGYALTYPVGTMMFWLLLFGGTLILALGLIVKRVIDIRADYS